MAAPSMHRRLYQISADLHQKDHGLATKGIASETGKESQFVAEVVPSAARVRSFAFRPSFATEVSESSARRSAASEVRAALIVHRLRFENLALHNVM